jgi:hypothetical protein
MADYPEMRQMPSAVAAPGRTMPPYSQTTTTVNVPARSSSALVPALAAAAVVAIVGFVAWSVLDDDTPVTPSPTDVAPAQPAPVADPPVVPEGDPAPTTPPAGDPPATPPAATNNP